jgi:fatty acid desaturase
MNPKDIWQNQKSENPAMSVQEIREKVGKLRAKLRREMVFNLVVSIVCTAFFIRVFVLYVHSVYDRISWGLVVAGAFYMLGRVVYESVQTMRAECIYGDAGISSCLRFYRWALERKRQHVRHMAFAAVVLVAGAIMAILPAVALALQHPEGNIWIRLAPFWIILGLWGLLYFLMRRRIRHEFRREFAMLETLEREYSPFPQNDK